MQCKLGGIIALASEPISGDPLRFAVPRTREDRTNALRESWIPFFRTIDSAAWARGAFPPKSLSA
jgi:hypothetical protein